MYKPTWSQHEKDIQTTSGGDRFLAERDREMASNPEAKAWEESRKRSLQKQKHDYSVKEHQTDQLVQDELLAELKQGGSFDEEFIPMPGFIVVEVEQEAKMTDSGLALPDSMATARNVGIVCNCSSSAISFVEPGDKIVFKKGAGLDIEIKGKPYKLMRCVEDIQITDVLGVLR